MTTENPIEQYEQLLLKRNLVRDKILKAQANYESAQANLDRITKQSVEEYGTADINVLMEMRNKIMEENKVLVQNFANGIRKAENQLEEYQKAIS